MVRRLYIYVFIVGMVLSGCSAISPDQLDTSVAVGGTASEAVDGTEGVEKIDSDTPIIGGSTVSFENLFEGQVDAPIWLFAVADDEGRIILSAEIKQGISMAEFDPENPEAKLDWKEIVPKAEVGNGVADHWHVFAHGYHYLVFSQPEADSAYAVKVDKNLKRVAMEHIVDKFELTEEEGSLTDDGYLITNDMFLVPEEDGVTAAFFLPSIGHKLFRMDEDLQVYETKNIGGGEQEHGNGSSALMTEDGFDVLANDTIMSVQQSGVQLLRYDKDWDFVEAIPLVDFDYQSIGMTSGAYLEDGSFVLHTRTNVDAYGRGERPKPPTQDTNGKLSDDGGNIARYLFDSDFQLTSVEYLYEGTKAHRPHTTVIGDLLITTWDGGSTWATIRVDKIK